jgi:hypothetical protein
VHRERHRQPEHELEADGDEGEDEGRLERGPERLVLVAPERVL